MKIDGKAHGRGEIIENTFQVNDMLRDGTDDDEGVIGILKDRARKVVNQRMEEQPLTRGQEKQLLENVSHNVEKEGRKGVSLAKTSAALNPAPRDAIEKNSSLAGVVEHLNPGSPKIGKTFGQKDPVESLPADGVEGFAKVKLENGGRGGAPMARLNDVSSIDKIFSNRAASNETSLVRVNEERNEGAKSKGETFGMDLKATVLKRDGAKIVRSIGANLLGEKDDVGFVDRPKIRGKRVKIMESRG
jgi:hypothetical protein